MKRILIAVLFILIILPSVAAMPFVKFNGNKYSLYFSAKSPEDGSFINEYYKSGETYENWTELIGVYHYPNEYSPIEFAKSMSEQLNSISSPNTLMINDTSNSALLDFILVDSSRMPMILEFNVFKYEKSPVCGTVTIQYAKRYLINNMLEIDEVKSFFDKNREKCLNKVEKLKIPELVTYNIERGKYVKNEGIISEDITGLD